MNAATIYYYYFQGFSKNSVVSENVLRLSKGNRGGDDQHHITSLVCAPAIGPKTL